MKSSDRQLEERGFLPEKYEIKFDRYSLSEKLELLESKKPIERTLGARLLTTEKETKGVIEKLIISLTVEKKLYPKIEISRTLTSFGKQSVKALIQVLGEIGKNQHKEVPKKEFKKDNYPLPRDISSRALANIGIIALPELLDNLEKTDIKQLSEVIDAIGFICFYDYCSDTYKLLKKCYLENLESELIKWKIIRAFSRFPESESFLNAEKRNLQNVRLLTEIERSISLIKKRN